MRTWMNNPTTRPNPSADRPCRGRRRSSPEHPAQPRPAANLLMENVKILKRGEPLTSFLPERSSLCSEKDLETAAGRRPAPGDLSLGSTNRLGPDPETVMKELPIAIPRKGFAMGGGYATSPHPSLVPLPGFLSEAARGGAEIATHGSRRLLGVGLA